MSRLERWLWDKWLSRTPLFLSLKIVAEGRARREEERKQSHAEGRTFVLRGGAPHRASYIHQGQELLEDGEEITVCEIKTTRSAK